MNILHEKLKEVILSVVPIVFLVILLNFTIISISFSMLAIFLSGALMIILGLTLFLLGVDLGIVPLGALLGSIIAKKNKLVIVILAGLILGFFISIAEPDLLILANQIDFVTMGEISSIKILVVVSIGIASTMVLAFLRILYNIPLYIILNILYLIILILGIFAPAEFLAIAFDASGSTTGILAVPFMLAISIGITFLKKDNKSSQKDSFGMIAITSAGAVISVMILSLFNIGKEYASDLALEADTSVINFNFFRDTLIHSFFESFMALLPLLIIFLLIVFSKVNIEKREIRKISFGFIYLILGLILFFMGVHSGFMKIGKLIGIQISEYNNSNLLLGIGFIFGMVTILAEPAVYVLTKQIEEITAGYVKRRSVLIALSLGVGLAISLSMLRIMHTNINLWHYLLPGYIIALVLSFIAPKLFVGIAFDAGGVATGPMTATFILAFTQGVASTFPNSNILRDGFGMIAMVAMMPIISLQILGVIFKIKLRKKVGLENEGN